MCDAEAQDSEQFVYSINKVYRDNLKLLELSTQVLKEYNDLISNQQKPKLRHSYATKHRMPWKESEA